MSFICCLSLNGTAQLISNRVTGLLQKLDSISNSQSVSRHFAGIYFITTTGAIDFFSKDDEQVQQLIERFELRFAGFFFRSADAFNEKTEVPAEWKAYYADTTAPSLRYILYGINAHINGDIWQALVTEFSADEIKELKQYYLRYYKGLKKDYDEYYSTALHSNTKMKLLHAVSLGLDKPYGKVLLNRWRRRQLELAGLYFSNKPLFEKKLKKLHRKMHRTNELIRRNI